MASIFLNEVIDLRFAIASILIFAGVYTYDATDGHRNRPALDQSETNLIEFSFKIGYLIRNMPTQITQREGKRPPRTCTSEGDYAA
jgi:hypothetical protein